MRASRLVLATVLLALAGTAGAQTLLVDRVRQEAGIAKPVRGMSMAQVEARFGAPMQRLDPRGGQKRQWPTIHRWMYPAYTVYFEKSKVIDVVLNKADAQEVGPAPPIR